jgi:hypothetical protein
VKHYSIDKVCHIEHGDTYQLMALNFLPSPLVELSHENNDTVCVSFQTQTENMFYLLTYHIFNNLCFLLSCSKFSLPTSLWWCI